MLQKGKKTSISPSMSCVLNYNPQRQGDDISPHAVITSAWNNSSSFQPHLNWNRMPKHLAILVHSVRLIFPGCYANTCLYVTLIPHDIEYSCTVSEQFETITKPEATLHKQEKHRLHTRTFMTLSSSIYTQYEGLFFSTTVAFVPKVIRWEPRLICMAYH